MANRYTNEDYSKALRDLSTVIDWGGLFPKNKKKPDARSIKKLSRYTKKKIKNAHTEYLEHGGKNLFQTRNKTLKELAQCASGTSDYFKGYFSRSEYELGPNPGELKTRVLTNARAVRADKKTRRIYKELIIRPFERGALTVTSDVETLKHLIRSELSQGPDCDRIGLQNGTSQYNMVFADEPELLVDMAAKDYEKYSQGADEGRHRIRLNKKGKQYDAGVMAHPSLWMTGVVFWNPKQ